MPVSDTAAKMQEKKSKKVLALTKGVAIVTLVASFLLATLALFLLLYSQERVSDRILDCTIPSGKCYQEKTRAAQVTDFVDISSIIEYCATIDSSTPKVISNCVEREMKK